MQTMALAQGFKGLAGRVLTSDLVDQLFTPHGIDGYLGLVAPGLVADVSTRSSRPIERTENSVAVHRTLVPGAPVSSTVADVAPSRTGAQVRFSDSALEVTAEADTTLLALAEQHGLEPKYRCRRGICGTCTTTKTAGIVRDTRTGELSSPDETPIRICVSVPCGDVAVAL